MKQNLKQAVNLTALVLAAGPLIGLLTGCPNAGSDYTPGPFITDGYGTIKSYDGVVPNTLVIPGKIGEEVITKIGENVFLNCTGLTSVSFPASLIKIGEDAFSGCTSLRSLDLYGCTSLTKIDTGTFSRCEGLTEVKLPANLTEIGEFAFWSCTGLTSLTIDSTNTKYKTESNILYTKDGKTLVFAAGGLTSVEIPNIVTEIGKYAFCGCTGLASAAFADKNGWKVYDDGSYSGTPTSINSSDLANTATAAKYLHEDFHNGGYSDKYWKKN